MKINNLKMLSIMLSASLVAFSCTNGNEPDPDPTVDPNATPYITKVYEYLPAPGQHVNTMPHINEGATNAEILAAAQTSLVGANGTGVTLGGFGGYVVFGFDHTVVNKNNLRDFRILSNAFNQQQVEQGKSGGSYEPGIVMVSVDANKNGIPDDEWYEIAGSEYNSAETIKNYEITYFKPESEPTASSSEYIRWEDNQGASGWKEKNGYHSNSYFPYGYTGESITFKGTKLADNAELVVNGSMYLWVLYPYGFGYADNALNDEANSAIDIDWAVDKDGIPANLTGIDFVKVMTGVNQEAGVVGEVSTDVMGAIDLHVKGELIAK